MASDPPRETPPTLRWILTTVLLAAFFMPPPAATAQRVARLDPTEPLFTEPAFLDQSFELGSEWAKSPEDHGIEVAPSIEWIFWNRLEVALEVPVGINVPDQGDTVADLSDIGLGAKFLLCCETHKPLDFLSFAVGVDLPTGDRSKGIGGDGAWEVSILPGRYFNVTEHLPPLLTQLQLSYAQQIRLDDDAREAASALDQSKIREKEILWNMAFSQQYFGGVFQPVFEILGTTIVDAQVGNEQGTILELGSGFWLAPHPDEHFFRAVTFGLGFKLPVTSHKDDQSVGVFVIEYAIE